MFVECRSFLSIPLYRLVQFQFEPHVQPPLGVPETLCKGRVLSAVYRLSHAAKSSPYGLALRLMVDPRLAMVDRPVAVARATA